MKKLQVKLTANKHPVMHMWKTNLKSKSMEVGSELAITSVEIDCELLWAVL